MKIETFQIALTVGPILATLLVCAWALHVAYWKGHDDGMRAGKAIEGLKNRLMN